MIKLAFAAAAIVAAGTTVAITHPWSRTTSTAQAATIASDPAPAGMTVAARPVPTPSHARVTTPPMATQGAPQAPAAPAADQLPVLDLPARAHAHLDRGPSRGPATAPVTIVVFTDLLCSHCGNALGTIDQLWEEYPNKLRLVMKQMPVHQAAVLPAEASFAADAQGKFWELHDLMIAHQDDLSRDAILVLAAQGGLDVPALRAALDTHQYAAAVEADKASAAELELTGTPAFVINGRRVIGNLPVADLRATIDDALANP